MIPTAAELAQRQALAVLVTYLLLASFLLATLAVIASAFKLRKTCYVLHTLYGFFIFTMPMNATLYAGIIIMLTGIGALIKEILEGRQSKKGKPKSKKVQPKEGKLTSKRA